MPITRRVFAGAGGLLALNAFTGSARSETVMSTLPFAADAPVSVTSVGIKARDINALADYYKHTVGLAEVARRPGVIVLGTGGRALLEIEEFRAGRPDDPRAAGLYHTAFLVPSRPDLARWTQRAISERIQVTGASDHLVSEAIYLTDPEGNGIEIYADRSQETWSFDKNSVKMATLPLDVKNLLSEIKPGDEDWQAAPADSMVGHVHLRVGNVGEAEKWWNETLGFDTMLQFGGSAVFLSTGGYHHHVGVNSWQSAGAKDREPDRTGLAFVEFQSRTAKEEASYEDPWGNVVRVVPAAA